MQNQYRYKIMEILKTTGEKMNSRDFLQYFPGLISGIGSDAQAASALSSALSDMFAEGLIFRNHRKCTLGNMSKFNYFVNAAPETTVNLAENGAHAEIESLRHEVARLREQCEQHQVTEARNENEIADAHKKIHQLERMKALTRVDCTRGYNVFAVQDGHFIDEVTLDEAVTEAKRLAELQELDYVVVETAALAIFSKTVTIEVIGK
jgi:hypothetical protein